MSDYSSDSQDRIEEGRGTSNGSDETTDNLMDEDVDEVEDDMLDDDQSDASDQAPHHVANNYANHQLGNDEDDHSQQYSESDQREDDDEMELEIEEEGQEEVDDDDDDNKAIDKDRTAPGLNACPPTTNFTRSLQQSEPSEHSHSDLDSDDDIPLSVHGRQNYLKSTSQPAINQTLKRSPKPSPKLAVKLAPKQEPLPEPHSDSDPDYDVPIAELARRMFPAKKKQKARSPSTSKRRIANSATKPRAKSGTKRVKKEDDEKPTRKFEKPGQKRETPPENDPARLFYESMYAEKMKRGKRSEMAEGWMLKHGLLDDDVANKIIAETEKKKRRGA